MTGQETLSALPDGYQTPVGERGSVLSGGERQRVALARAYLRDAPILILDEPTSAVDVQTESTVFQALDRLMAGRTTFIISHRTGTLDSCDVVLHVNSGTVRAGAQDGATPKLEPHQHG